MRSRLITSALAISLGLGTPVVSAIWFSEGVVAQTVEEKKKEADRLHQQGREQFQSRQFEAALQSWQQALKLYRDIKDRQGEVKALSNLGYAYISLQNYVKAVEYLEQSLAIYQQIKDDENESVVLINLGIAYVSLSQYEKAIAYFEKARSIYQQVKDRNGEAVVLLSLGSAYVSLSQYEKAIAYFEKAQSIYQQVKDRKSEADALTALGLTYWLLLQHEKAIISYEQARLIYQQVQDGKSEAEVSNYLGSAYVSLSQYKEAIVYFEKARSIYQQVKDGKSEAEVSNYLGSAYASLSQYEEAIVYFEKARSIYQQVKDLKSEASVLTNLGVAYVSLSQYEKAIGYYEQARPIFQQVKDLNSEASVLMNLGVAYGFLSQHEKAIGYYEQAKPIFKQVKDRNGEGKVLGNLGNAYVSLSQYEKAIGYYEQARPIFQQVKNLESEASVLMNLGVAYVSLSQYEKAIGYYEQAKPIFQQVKDRNGEARVLANLGNAYGFLSQYEKAIGYYEQAKPIFQQVKDRDGEARGLANLGILFVRRKEQDLAIAFYKQSVNVAESIRADLRKLPRETQEIYTSTVSSTYRDLADLLLIQGRTREAQAILELLKVQESQIYDEQQQKPLIQFPLHPLEIQAWQQIEKQKSFTLASLEPLGNSLKQNRDRITQDMNAMAIAIGNPSALLNAKPHTILIQNLVVGDRLWVIWTNAKGEVKTIALDVKQQQLTETVDRLRKALGNPNSNLAQLKATSQQLYNWLIPPALQTELAQNPNTQLLFSLDHVTRYIPIAALYDGQQYLIQKHTLSNLITTDTDMGDRLAPNGQTPNILALGTSKPLAGFSALPNVEAELYAIVRTQDKQGKPRGIYPGTLHLNEAFTANSLRTAAPHRILHIATHGSFNPKTITASFLLLGNGDKLPITDIATLTNLNDKHLVVLSACETGISSSTADGTEISGISNYFLRRGAKSVLASLWNVNDASTALMMQQFYQHLAQGMTKAEALKTVQQDFIHGKLTAKDAPARADIEVTMIPGAQGTASNFSHPYYWAPFILTGNSL